MDISKVGRKLLWRLNENRSSLYTLFLIEKYGLELGSIDITYTLEGIATLFFNEYKYFSIAVIGYCELHKPILKY
ncbi:hypothetical protein HA151_06230 [Prochlorococcus marinus XMU1419]|uniref:hypothetical protein n=1 Tax=Prochlorococcus marinus TaxID=1219 RepID=UPI001ADB3BC2|nr:hypothetical protein [Prochlorococcus marinus]MBO8234114.1 hypothetical protein [Prochlorococcus marinus XMU1419]